MSQPIILHYPASFSTTWLQHCIHNHTDKPGGGVGRDHHPSMWQVDTPLSPPSMLTFGWSADWCFMISTLTGEGLLWTGCSLADKGQVSSPSAALITRASSDPSPEKQPLGQSIVSNRVPAFRVTSPSLLLLLQPAHSPAQVQKLHPPTAF